MLGGQGSQLGHLGDADISRRPTAPAWPSGLGRGRKLTVFNISALDAVSHSTMGYHGFTQRQGYMYQQDLERGATYHQRHRQQLFTRTELAVLIPLTTLATGFGVFTFVYSVNQRSSTIQPAAIATLGVTSLLLIVVVFLVFQRLRRTASSRIAGPGAEETAWQTWANAPPSRPVPVPYHRMVQETTEPGELYAAIPIAKPRSPTPSTFASRLRLALENSVGAGLLSRGSFDSESLSTANEDRELLLHPDSGRSSVETSESARGHGLWHSIFELPAEAKLEKLRQKNLKRLSKESRRSMQEMSGSDRPASMGDGSPKIVVTRPRATASRPGDSRRSWAPSSSDVSLRETSLTFDPLRANPVQLKRDPSMRQTRSSHDLGGLCKNSTRAPTAPRPRSAEPGLDRCALGHGSMDLSPPRGTSSLVTLKPVSPPTLEHERRPARREAPDTLRSMTVSPITPKQELKTYPALRETTAAVGVSPVSPLSFAERMAQREKGRRRAGSPSVGAARDARDLRAAYRNRV